jgi:hypothetical protein
MSLRNLNPLTDADIPSTIARDVETEAAITGHLAAADPHSQYLNFVRGDARYEYRSSRASKSVPGPLSFSTSSWSSLGTIPGFSLGTQGEPSAILVAFNFLFDVRYPWQQAVCSGVLSAVWWQPVITADSGLRVPIEIHRQAGFYAALRISPGTGTPDSSQNSGENRYVEIKPESLISIPSGGRADMFLKKLL